MKIRTAAVVALPVLAAAAWLYAGPLNPPSGPIASTGKTLTEVEPRIAINSTNTPGDADSVYRISASGSYYLPGNMVAGTGKSAIEIAASNVTIDLNGFTITSLSTLPSIRLSLTGRTNITIRNGNIGALGDGGIDIAPNLVGTPTEGGCVENVHVSGTSGVGIMVGNGVLVRACTASNNSSDGMSAGSGCNFVDCVATDNGRFGIRAGDRSVVRGCAARANASAGLRTDTAATIVDCVSTENATAGISASTGSTVSRCTTAYNGGTGIAVANLCTVSQCNSISNGGLGIAATVRCTVSDCNASQNDFDGIEVSEKCIVIGNNAAGNGNGGDGAGIFATSSDNRIQNNNCTGADRGIDVDGTGNIITGNTCSGNTTNWTVVTGNACLVVSATATISVINGDSGGTSPGSTNPFANFTY